MRDRSRGFCLSWTDKVLFIMRKMEVLKIDNTEAKVKGKMVPIWEKYMLTVDEAVQYFGIGEKKIRMLISENVDSDFCFTVQVGNKSLINRHKFEEFLNQTTSL
jgi:excisionase family DNA binding protein